MNRSPSATSTGAATPAASSRRSEPWNFPIQIAVESGDRRALAELAADPALRARLPQALVPEPACDAANAESPGTVVVAATEERGAGAPAPRSPWSLWWSRDPRGWRLAGAAPVLQ